MQLIAHTFSLTYNDRASLSSKPSLQELVHAEHLLKYGGDAAGYVDVNILQVVLLASHHILSYADRTKVLLCSISHSDWSNADLLYSLNQCATEHWLCVTGKKQIAVTIGPQPW